jgi:hypothetical protein
MNLNTFRAKVAAIARKHGHAFTGLIEDEVSGKRTTLVVATGLGGEVRVDMGLSFAEIDALDEAADVYAPLEAHFKTAPKYGVPRKGQKR